MDPCVYVFQSGNSKRSYCPIDINDYAFKVVLRDHETIIQCNVSLQLSVIPVPQHLEKDESGPPNTLLAFSQHSSFPWLYWDQEKNVYWSRYADFSLSPGWPSLELHKPPQQSEASVHKARPELLSTTLLFSITTATHIYRWLEIFLHTLFQWIHDPGSQARYEPMTSCYHLSYQHWECSLCKDQTGGCHPQPLTLSIISH